MWNLLCQYNNIYACSYKYLKRKKSTNGRLKEKKKNYNYYSYSATWANQSGIVAIVQNLGEKKGSLHQKALHQKGHCRGIASSYIVSRKKSTNRWLGKKKKYILN